MMTSDAASSGAAALLGALFLTGCVTAPADQQDYRTVIARSLGHYVGDVRHFSVTEPWSPLGSGLMACVRLDVPDGRGGFAPSMDFSMYQIEDGRVATMFKDNSLLGCTNRAYSELLPVKP
jgi:hypothetical protein